MSPGSGHGQTLMRGRSDRPERLGRNVHGPGIHDGVRPEWLGKNVHGLVIDDREGLEAGAKLLWTSGP